MTRAEWAVIVEAVLVRGDEDAKRVYLLARRLEREGW